MGAEERRECRSCILSGKADIAFEHLLDELRLLAGSPKRRAMHDPIAKWTAVSAFTARDRPRNKTNSVRYNVEGDVMNLADLARAVDSTSKKVRQKIDRLTAPADIAGVVSRAEVVQPRLGIPLLAGKLVVILPSSKPYNAQKKFAFRCHKVYV